MRPQPESQSQVEQQAAQQQQQVTRSAAQGGDHDQPYRFGYQPNHQHPFPFNTRQYARLLVLRSRVQSGLFGADDVVLA